MDRSALITALPTILVSVIVSVPHILNAQTNVGQEAAPNTADLLRAIDQLLDQNRRLEAQNQQLIEQISQLRLALAAQPPSSADIDPLGDSGLPRDLFYSWLKRNRFAGGPFWTSALVDLGPHGGIHHFENLAPVDLSAQTARPPLSLPGQSPAGSASAKPPTSQTSDQSSATTPTTADDKTRLPEASNGNPTVFGEFNPGRGFVVGRGRYGELDLSGYMVARYLNQLPPEQSATDHLGRPIPIEPRNDFQFHRVMLFSQGWLFDPKFQYMTFLWTVQDTNQVAIGGALSYSFNKYLNLGAGWNAYPGTQSLQGSHPYWETYDRVMADEFFRPYFSQGVFAQGNLLRTLQYRWMVGNNNSNLDVPATKLDRDLSAGGAITWLPTTGEFGPRGAFGDYESHKKLATRFNLAYTFSPEERQSPIGTPADNTTLRLADSLNIFDTGALANGVTVERAHYKLLSAAAGMKYRGFWLQGEGYGRRLDRLIADGPLPVSAVRNTGFYVQAADMIVPKIFELYASTSYVFGDFAHHPHEFIFGANYYPWNTRNARLNLQVINVSHSPVSSTFGFYIGQITGQVVALGVTALY